MTRVADAIRNVTAAAQRAYDEGERSAMIDLHDLVEVLLAIADELDVTVEGRSGCEFCRVDLNRPDGEFNCHYCHTRWPVVTPPGAELLAAARALLEAREDQIVTSAEWDRLRKAVDAG